MSIKGIDVWYVLPAMITAFYYCMRDWGLLPSQGRQSKPEAVSSKLEAPIDTQWWTLRNRRADAELERVALRTQRDVLRALFEEQLRASRSLTPTNMGPVGVEQRMEILGQMLGNNGVQLEPSGNGLMVTMGLHRIAIPMPPVGYLIPHVADAINQLQMRGQNQSLEYLFSTAIGGGAGVLGGMFKDGRGDKPSHIGDGWGSPVTDLAIVRVPRPPLLTKEPPWNP